MKKKKRIYAKIKEPYIVTDKAPENPIQMLSEIFHFENVWTDFIHDVFYKHKEISQPYEQNLFYIMHNMKDNQLKSDMAKILMRSTYNPYIDSFPLEKFPENQRNMIIKIQTKLKNEREAVEKEEMKKPFPIKVKGDIYRAIMIKNQTMPVSQYLFSLGYQVIVIVGKREVVFTSNPFAEHRPDFSLVYKVLNELEPGVWYLHGNNGLLKTEKGKSTRMKISEILPIFYRKELNVGYSRFKVQRLVEKE